MKNLLEKGLLFDTDGAGGDGAKGDPKPKGDKQEKGDKDKGEPTFDQWHEGLDDGAKELLKGHVSGLKTSLATERDARSEAETSVRDLAKKAEKGSEAQAELTKLADTLAESNQQLEFYEQAHSAGITNMKLAYIVAQQDDLINKRGVVNIEKLKENYPELFSKTLTPGADAGDGKEQKPKPKAGMNEALRAAAGKS